MSGTFGYELNPEVLSEEEKDEIRAQIRKRNEYAELIHFGSYYRLSDPFTSIWKSTETDLSRMSACGALNPEPLIAIQRAAGYILPTR